MKTISALEIQKDDVIKLPWNSEIYLVHKIIPVEDNQVKIYVTPKTWMVLGASQYLTLIDNMEKL